MAGEQPERLAVGARAGEAVEEGDAARVDEAELAQVDDQAEMPTISREIAATIAPDPSWTIGSWVGLSGIGTSPNIAANLGVGKVWPARSRR
jgi:hypothetical protein